MMLTRSAFRLLPMAALLFATACQDLPEPTSPVDPSFNAQANPRAHTAQDLRAWFAAASPEAMALPQTVYAAHDLAANLLVFGVQNANAARGVQMALSRRGIPATAYRIEQAEPIEFMNLRARHRPTMGGLQIHWSNYVCTLGFNVAHSAGRSFITNSHCTANQGSTGNTAYYQPSSSVDSSPIAFEADDPSYSRIAGCSGGKVCRYSDAARALYVSGAESAQGVIAKTTGVNNGSLDTSGSFSVTSQDNSSTSFSGVVHKVGRTTGWSSGNVTSSCATVNVSGSNIQLLCQTLVQRSGSVIVQGGDSGSPVFRVTSGDNVQLVGILWGGNTSGDLFVFSPLKSIQDELGAFNATTSGSTPPGDGGDDPPPGEEPPCVPRGNSGKCR
ncbi:MAG TPA: hypothetical protein VK929_11750 [Longimicrobiales bacterium]|nr:hypothetical protein [Longimicrobiales bacterium]